MSPPTTTPQYAICVTVILCLHHLSLMHTHPHLLLSTMLLLMTLIYRRFPPWLLLQLLQMQLHLQLHLTHSAYLIPVLLDALHAVLQPLLVSPACLLSPRRHTLTQPKNGR